MGHPLYVSHGHRLRLHPRWTKSLGRRLPDINVLNDPVNPNQYENIIALRETYAQYVLIMFHPFRIVTDLLPTGTTSWWESYLRKREQLMMVEDTRRTLNNIQNYYESFCRSPITNNDEDLPSKHGVEKDDDDAEEDDLVIDLVHAAQFIGNSSILGNHLDDANKLDPFIHTLRTFVDPILSVTPDKTSTTTVKTSDAEAAVSLLPSSTKNIIFKLPGRAYLDATATATIQNTTDTFPQTLDVTRVDLLEKIATSLETVVEPWKSIVHAAELDLETNYPTLKQHAQAWLLNEKQWQAFVLAGAAILKYTYLNLQSNMNSSNIPIEKFSSSIIKWLDKILPSSGQLIMFLG